MTTAERAGQGPSQDRIFRTDNAVIVLDGASEPGSSSRDGGWMAQTLGEQLQRNLLEDPQADLRRALRDAIATVAARHTLTPRAAPSSTVSIIRWTAEDLEALVLGDTPVAVQTTHGATETVRDDRLANVAYEQRRACLAVVESKGIGHLDTATRQALVEAERAHRNQPGGYWIGEAVPQAADHAIVRRWPRDEVAAAIAMTDGVTDAVDLYHVVDTWTDLAQQAIRRPDRIIELVDRAEASDPEGRRWHRLKRHDDKAIAAVTLLPNGSAI